MTSESSDDRSATGQSTRELIFLAGADDITATRRRLDDVFTKDSTFGVDRSSFLMFAEHCPRFQNKADQPQLTIAFLFALILRLCGCENITIPFHRNDYVEKTPVSDHFSLRLEILQCPLISKIPLPRGGMECPFLPLQRRRGETVA